jgi:hypothetical protein
MADIPGAVKWALAAGMHFSVPKRANRLKHLASLLSA